MSSRESQPIFHTTQVPVQVYYRHLFLLAFGPSGRRPGILVDWEPIRNIGITEFSHGSPLRFNKSRLGSTGSNHKCGAEIKKSFAANSKGIHRFPFHHLEQNTRYTPVTSTGRGLWSKCERDQVWSKCEQMTLPITVKMAQSIHTFG